MHIRTNVGTEIEIPEPKRSDFPAGWRGGLAYTLTEVFYKVMEIMGEGLGHFAGGVGEGLLQVIEEDTTEAIAPLLDEMLAIPDLPPYWRALFEALRHPEGQALGGLAMSLGGSAGGAAISSILSVLLAPVTYGLAHKIRPARPSPGDLQAMFWRGLIDRETMDDWYGDQGWPPIAAAAYDEILRSRLGISGLGTALLRGDISDADYVVELGRRGVPHWDIAELKRLLQLIPGPSDLVRMAVREAWDDATAREWGYDDRFDPNFAEWMAKQGMSAEWAKRYWRAHWVLPSVGAGYEMLHRRVIDKGELRHLMSIADIAPGWIDRLIEISYTPYTRVDVRRMYKFGVLDEKGVYEAYLDHGFDPERALKMTEFTIAYYDEVEREATKTDILEAYKIAQINRTTAHSYLVSIGIQPLFAEVYLKKIDHKVAEEEEKQHLDLLKVKYVNWEIDEGGLLVELGRLNLPAIQMEKLTREWTISRKAKIERPTLAKWEEFFRHEVVDMAGYVEGVKSLGYSDGYANMYRDSLIWELQEEAAKTAERERKEQEREALSEFRDERRMKVQAINVAIADHKLVITEAYAALRRVLSDEDRRTARLAIVEGEERIAKLRTAQTVKGEELRRAKATLEDLLPTTIRERLEGVIATTRLEIAEFRTTLEAKEEELRIAEDTLAKAIPEVTRERLEKTITEARLESAELLVAIPEWTAAAEELSTRIKEMPEGGERDAALADLNLLLTKIETGTDTIASHEVTIRESLKQLETFLPHEERERLEATIEGFKVEIADIKLAIREREEIIKATQAELATYLPLDELAHWEEIIETLNVEISDVKISIKEEQEAIAGQKIILASEPTAEQREAIESNIDTVRIAIAQLEIERASVPTVMPTAA